MYTGPDFRFIPTKDCCLTVDSLDICPQVVELSQRLSSANGIVTDISLGGIRTLQEARMVNREVMAMEAKFMHKLQENRKALNHCLIHLQQQLAHLPPCPNSPPQSQLHPIRAAEGHFLLE